MSFTSSIVFPSFELSKEQSCSKAADSRRICIATSDYLFFVKNGGMGTSFHHTARVLAENGWEVTVLFCNSTHHLNSGQLEKIQANLSNLGISSELLFPQNFSEEHLKEFSPSDIFSISSYQTYHYLKDRNFDIVLFHEWRGLGFYSVLAKNCGLAFTKTRLWVQTHSTALWHALASQHYVYSPTDTRMFHMERKSVEYADLVVSPTQYLLNWKNEHGFSFPEATFVQPYLLSDDMGCDPIESRTISRVKEIVFFGRLEKRKGLHIFLQALKRASADKQVVQQLRNVTFTFLGKIADVDGTTSVDYILDFTQDLRLNIKLITALDSDEAVRYLIDNNAVAVIPSVADNSPLTVLECIRNNIPFIAAKAGGIPEIIADFDHDTVLFDVDARSLAEKMIAVILHGHRSAMPAISQQVNIQAWLVKLEDDIAKSEINKDISLPIDDSKISVCITHYNRPTFLEITLHGLVQQTYKNFEVIIVDDGSNDFEAISYLENLEKEDFPFDVQIIYQCNEFVGAARNKALSKAKGKYIVFMDDDNYASPVQIETFVKAMKASNFDALTCVAVVFPEDEDPRSLSRMLHLYLPLGSGLAPNLFGNFYGDANAIFLRETLNKVGGFTEDQGISYEDYELLSMIECQGGKVGVIPEPLLYLRHTTGSVSRRGSQLANYYRALRPALKGLPWSTFGDAILVSLNSSFRDFRAMSQYRESDLTETQKHLRSHVPYDFTSLRWLARRMKERGFVSEVIDILITNSKSSSTLHFGFFDAIFYAIGEGISSTSLSLSLSMAPDAEDMLFAVKKTIATKTTSPLREYFLNEGKKLMETSVDVHFLMGKMEILDGKILQGLLIIKKALDTVNAKYLSTSSDVNNAVLEGYFRSGIDHFLSCGQKEGRSIDYCEPLAQPFSIYSDALELRDFTQRMKNIKNIGLELNRQAVYEQLLIECLETNSALAFYELACSLINEINSSYLNHYPDVAKAFGPEVHLAGISHYLSIGINEQRHIFTDEFSHDRIRSILNLYCETYKTFGLPCGIRIKDAFAKGLINLMRI